MIRACILIALVALLGGCATTESSVTVPYAAASPASDIGHGQAIALKTLDARTADRMRISTKINGFGMEMAAIRSARPVTDIVQDALAAEFQARGFHIGAAGCPVTVSVDRFYNQFHTGAFAGTADGTAALMVTVADPTGSKLFSKTYNGVSQETIELANGSNAALAVSAALKDAVNKLFADPSFLRALASQATIPAAQATGKPTS